jgi:transposase-like protein
MGQETHGQRVFPQEDGVMARTSRYSQEVRERAVRMVFEHRGEYDSKWEAICSIAEKIGCSSESFRKWVRRMEVDSGRPPKHRAGPEAGRPRGASVGLGLRRGYGLHHLVQSPRCLERGEVAPVRRPRRRSHEGDQALRQATGADSPIRRGDAPNAAGPDTELAVTPGADVHRTAFPSQNC